MGLSPDMGEIVVGPVRTWDLAEQRCQAWRSRYPDLAARVDAGDYHVFTVQWAVKPLLAFWQRGVQDRYTYHLVRSPAPPVPPRRLPG